MENKLSSSGGQNKTIRPSVKKIVLAEVIIILILAIAMSRLFAYKKINPATWTCNLLGGKWELVNIRFGIYNCIYYYPDGGKACIQKSDCRGACVLTGSVKNDSDGNLVGECKYNSSNLPSSRGGNSGCFSSVPSNSENNNAGQLVWPTKFDAHHLDVICNDY